MRAEHQILLHDDAERPAGPHLDGGLDIELPFHDLAGGAIGGLSEALSQGFHEIVFVFPKGQFSSNIQQCRKGDTFHELPGVIVNFVR